MSSLIAPGLRITVRFVAFLLSGALSLIAVASASAQTSVFVNELHYDNASTDLGEAIEIAGPAGTDLTGWSLVLYNGSNGSAYDTISLAGTLPCQDDGFGTTFVSLPTNGIQNGAPDGLALVDAGGSVVQFLSYEGSFTAVDGSAAGLTSTDIGVSEDSSTPIGFSLQLSGTGSAYEDFTWSAPAAETFGFVNSAQDFTGGEPCGAADPVINEFVANHTGTDDYEFIEILGDPSTDYDAYHVVEIEGDGSGAGVIDGAFLVGTTDAAGYWDTGFLGNSLENGTLTLLLVEGLSGSDGQDVDTNDDGVIDVSYWTRVVDCVAVSDGGSSDRTYCPTVLAPSFDGIVFTVGGASRIPDGSDTESDADWLRNDFDGAGIPALDPGTPEPGEALNTPGAENQAVASPPAAVRINEIRIDQPGADDDEYFELAGSAAASLDGLTYLVIGDGAAGSGVIENVTALSGFSIPAGGFFVAAEGSFALGAADLETNLNFENGDNVTHLLVQGFSGSFGSDLDADDDGTLDLEPWTSVVDCVALIATPGSGDRTYCATTVGPDGSFVPAHSLLCPTGWAIGDFDPDDGFDTPGARNACGRPIVNEIDYDQPGADGAEFVELTNDGAFPIDLDPFTLELINGSGGTSYDSVDLPGILLGPGEYYVICADASTVTNCDLEGLGSIQNGAPDAVAVTFGGTVVDAVSYEGDVPGYVEGSGVGLEDDSSIANSGISRFPDGLDTDQNSVDLVSACITPGRANSSLTSDCSPFGPLVEIFEIQGSGLISPLVGQTVRTEDNVVTAVGTDGFFLQTPDARDDGDGDTSNGIFVYTGSALGVSLGDRLDLTASVGEFFGLTQLTAADLDVDGTAPLPGAIVLDALTPSPDPTAGTCTVSGSPSIEESNFECLEGMLVQADTVRVTGPNQRFGSDPVAEVFIITTPERAFREPGIEFPGLSGLPVWDGNPEVFELDPDRLGLANAIIPAGSTLTEVVGVIGYEFGDYELWPTSYVPTFAPLPDPVRAQEVGEITIGSLNLFRLFDDVDDPADAAGRNDEVVSTAEWDRRRAKLARYIVEVLGCPDVLGVQEAESLTVLEALAATVASESANACSYAAYLEEGNDVGTIDVGFLVRDWLRVDAVTQLGKDEVLTFDGSLLHDRPPLVLEASAPSTFGFFPFQVMVVHMRSLGGIDDPSSGPRVRQKRYEQAQSIADKVQAIQSSGPGVALAVLGDFNAFEFTDGYVDVVGQILGAFDPADNLVCDSEPCDDRVEPDLTNEILGLPANERYSFIFRGSAQVLDHALISTALAPYSQGVEYGRGNADAALDSINDGSTLLRSSDHDGLVLYVETDSDADGVPDPIDVCLGTAIPESVPTESLGTNRWALVDDDGIFDTSTPPGGGPGIAFTLGHTGGCSCEQIIEYAGLGAGHEKFGCSTGEMLEWIELVNP